MAANVRWPEVLIPNTVGNWAIFQSIYSWPTRLLLNCAFKLFQSRRVHTTLDIQGSTYEINTEEERWKYILLFMKCTCTQQQMESSTSPCTERTQTYTWTARLFARLVVIISGIGRWPEKQDKWDISCIIWTDHGRPVSHCSSIKDQSKICPEVNLYWWLYVYYIY